MKYTLLLLTCLLFSCTKEVLVSREDIVERHKKELVERYCRFLPTDVKYIDMSLGNDWVVIEIGGNKFLYRSCYGFRERIEVMVPYVEK